MAGIKDLIEWDYCGSHYSVYVKHYIDDDGRKGMILIFEDTTYQKVTEIVIPSRKFPEFLRAINDGMWQGPRL